MVIRMDQELNQELSRCAESPTTTVSVSSTSPQSLAESRRDLTTRGEESQRSRLSASLRKPLGQRPNKNTRDEFRRLKTIVPSIRQKDRVSKLDIILEAIKYIDDLQDQLFDRLGAPMDSHPGGGERQPNAHRLETARLIEAIANCDVLRGLPGPPYSDESEEEFHYESDGTGNYTPMMVVLPPESSAASSSGHQSDDSGSVDL